MNQIIEQKAGLVADVSRYSVAEMRERINVVQMTMRENMKSGTHYGTIPGTNKPTLYKPGAEMLCVVFRIAQAYVIEDLSTPTATRFRVKCVGHHQTTETVLGEGVGECSSDEEKYKWRAALCDEEFETTPEHLRRVKFSKYQGKVEKRKQIKCDPADMANTVLKMACKRALIAMTLNVTAASDMFTQDLEDMPEELRPVETPIASACDPALLQSWLDEVGAANTVAKLNAVWDGGKVAIGDTKDLAAYTTFKNAIFAKKAALQSAEGGAQ